MASPLPSYPQADGSSYYHQPPPPHVPAPFIYEGRNTGPYPYPYPPSHMNNNAHQASSPRARQAHGAYIPLSSPTAGPSYQSYHTHTQHFPHPAQSHPYAHPHSKYPHPQPGPYSYGTPYSPAWSAQQPLSPLPKQLTMPPPRIVSPAPPSNPPPPIPSSPSTGTSPINASPPQPSPPPPPLAQAPSPRPPPIHQPKPSTNPSPPLTSPPLPDSGGWAIWSRRPQDPSRAPGIIISPRARPPPDIVQQALDIPTPPASPKCTPTLLVPSPPSPKIVESKVELEPRLPEPEPAQAESASSEHDITSSSATAETTPACSTSPGTSIPSSPQSSNTSVSMVAMSPGKIKVASSPLPADHLVIPDESGTAEAPPPSCLPPAPPPVKKSFASLFTTSSPQRPNSLPTSSVVGISIPASSPTPPPTALPTKNSELLALLTAISITSSGNIHPFRSRGLLNSGNMCFANAVLQVMVYCPPFRRLFTELGRILGGAGFASVVGKDRVVGGTPLVDGTIQFLKEFSMEDANKERDGKGKEVDKPRAGEGEEENPRDAFIPFYIYDAMKEKKRFETMRGGQQEDAEEFFGFYLDALEEELLSVVNVLSQPAAKGPPAHGQVEEREEDAPQPDEGWLEVGKKNRTVITRTVKTADSPITRIFGGKFRSTLRAPAQKDSVVVEDWRSLRLDIQRDQIYTIQDALASISHPQAVQVTFPTRPGVTVDANQQALIEALPPILVLHMKRFLYDASAGGVIKLNRQVRFGPELEVEPDVMAPLLRKPSPTRYKLFGVLYHHGQSASGGHYTLDVLHPDRFPDSNNPKLREGWVRIDDEVVSDIRPDDVFGDDRCAYLLFYTRLGGRSV